MKIREIAENDLADIIRLLIEGFPRRNPKYWKTGIDHLTRRPETKGFPRYGVTLEVNGQLQGVLLLLTSTIHGSIRSNLSSWYVREPFRNYATFMFKRVTRVPGTVYMNLSPSPAALPIAKAFGFKPYTGGVMMYDGRSAFKSDCAQSLSMTGKHLEAFDAETRNIIVNHLSYGCSGFVLEDHQGHMAALYRVKWLKGLVPAAQFVSGDTERLAKSSGTMMRTLAKHGIPIALMEIPLDPDPEFVMKPIVRMGRRYAKGQPIPAPGDLLETELSIFGP